MALLTSSRPHPPRADGEFDGGLNTLCFSIAQDPIRLGDCRFNRLTAVPEPDGVVEPRLPECEFFSFVS